MAKPAKLIKENGDRPSRKRATSYDVAELAGVSQSAVSRVFQDGASASKDMRDRVLSAANKLGYRPNAIARGLIEEEHVVELLQLPERTAVIVLTGRYAGEELMQHADTVTEMRCIQHGYANGIRAQKGVEF